MPIYAYKCGSCGHEKDVLQKLSDAPLTVCPSCGAAAFGKQLTAAGFQLKGSGWYATDFKNGSKPVPAPAADGAKPAEAPKNGESAKPADGAAKPAESSPATQTGAAKSDAPSASAGGGGGPSACH
jgi:putative FmdB family regulatory protein